MNPYKFKKILFNDSFLSNSTDATYIIHLENNGRYKHVQSQLSEYHPTNIVYILFNKGYKKSIKKPFINNSSLDLVDSFLEIFKHANKKKYNNILILEDDFIFSEKIKESEHKNNINNSIIKMGKTDFVYLLGCIPFIQIPHDLYNFRVISIGMHAVIYSKKNRINILKKNQEDIKDWDFYNNNNINNRITYYLPLCYQLFPETENSKNWCKDVNKIMYLASKPIHKIFKYLGLDTQTEPGTSIFYFLSKLFILILIIFLLIITKKYFHEYKINC
jgi:hypothetical protein